MQQAVQEAECPAFPPGVGMMVLVEAGSPGETSPELTPARLSLMKLSFQSCGRGTCDPSLGLLNAVVALETAS